MEDMEDLDVESVRRYLLEHTDLATRFPNWSSSLNLTDIVHVLLREDQVTARAGVASPAARLLARWVGGFASWLVGLLAGWCVGWLIG